MSDVREMAREHTRDAIAKLVDLMAGAADERTQAVAAQALLDRGWGRPAQALEHSGKDGAPLTVTVNVLPPEET